MRAFYAQRIQHLMNAIRHKPYAAARLSKLLHQLFIVARRERIASGTFDPVNVTQPAKVKSKGYDRWSEAELAKFDEKHPLGTKTRLAFSRCSTVRSAAETCAICHTGRLQGAAFA
ncbi:MAG: hypothetical protein DI637_10810 [Citromicrobium sp.]|nr:MAG: hypothetical protein DI637_10810 [Citromicrobium sp.]